MDNATPTKCHFEGHLNSPITDDEVEFLLNNDGFICSRHKRIKDLLVNNYSNIKSFKAHTSCPWKLIEETILKDTLVFSNKAHESTNLTQMVEASIWNLKIHHEAYYGTPMNLQQTEDQIRESFQHPIIRSTFEQKVKVEQIKTSLTEREQELGIFYQLSDNMWIEKELTIIREGKGNFYLYPTTMAICVMDNIQSRFYIQLHILLKSLQEGLPNLFDHYLTLDTFLRCMREKYANKFFILMKNWDSLIIGSTVSDQIEDMGFEVLRQSILNEFIEEGFENSDILRFDELVNSRIYLPDKDLAIRISFYLSNLNKNYGHPVLNPIDGIKKLRENSKKEIPVDDLLAKKVLWEFRRTYMYGFYRSRGKYPNYSLTTSVNPHLKLVLTESRLPTEAETNMIPLEDWQDVLLEKTHELSIELDEREFLKDTACSPPREEWFLPYDQCALKLLYNQRKPKGSGTYEPRVLARYLKGDLGELLKKINDQEHLHYNHTRDDITQLCRKERELNLLGRVFCKQTYEMRLLQVCLEKSLSDNILPFIKEQTMTNTELEVSKRMDKIASTISKEGNYNVNLDLTKWNQLQRHDLNKYLFNELDNLHGRKNLYSDSHFWFNRCMVLLGSRLTPPQIGLDGEPLPGDYCHYDQLGGFEGMRQKAWTLSTIMIIKIALEECHLTGETMGQGDNQVIHLKLTKEQQTDPHYYIRLFLNTLDNLFDRAGLKLKLHETWYSKNLFEYSKVRFFKAIRLDDSLKRLNRMIPDINEGFPSINSLLTSSSTCTENLSRNCSSPVIPFIINSFETCNILSRKNLVTKDSSRSLCALLNGASIMGGLPISNLYQHCQRGFSDPLTIWLRIWKVIRIQAPEIYKALLNIYPCIIKHTINPVRIVEDMYSLNIVSLPNFEREARDIIENFLPSYITNPNITKLMGASREDLRELCETLTTLRPYVANLAHEILKNSNEGIQLQLIGSFSNIQTINRLINEDPDRTDNIFTLGCMKDREAIKILKDRVENASLPHRREHVVELMFQQQACTFQIAYNLRELSWGFPIEGITSPVPCEQVSILNYDNLPKELKGDCIIAKTSHQLKNDGSSALKSRGPYQPYMGSSTPEKMTKPKLAVVSANPVTKAISKLYYLRSYLERMDGTSNVILLLNKMIENKLTCLPEEFRATPLEEWCGKNYGGSYEHRFKASSQKRSALYSLLTNIATHININTNQLGKALRGQKDYNLFFQELFLFIQNYITEMCINGYEVFDTYGVPLNCYSCTYLITPRKIDLLQSSYTINAELKYLEDNPLEDREKYHHVRTSVAGMSISIGRRIANSRTTSLDNSDLKESIGLSKGEDSSDRLSSNFITEFRSCDLLYLIVGMVQGNRDLFNYLNGTVSSYPVDALVHLSYLVINSDRVAEVVKLFKIHISKHSHVTQIKGFSLPLATALKTYFKNHNEEFMLACGLSTFKDDELSRQSYFWRRFIGPQVQELDLSIMKRSGILSIPLSVEGGIPVWSKKLPRGFTKNLTLTLDYPENMAIPMWREYKSEFNEYLTPHSPLTTLVLQKAQVQADPVQMGINHITSSVNQSCVIPFEVSTTVVEEMGNEYSPLWVKSIHHLTRQIGKISTAPSKIIDVLNLYDWIAYDATGIIVTLAEGSGGILNLLMHLYPSCKAIYNTLQTDTVEVKENVLNITPPSIVGDECNLESRLIGLNEMCLGETDITKPTFQDKLTTLLKENELPIIIWTMDAEMKTDMDNLDKLQLYLPLFVKYKTNKSLFINKMFINNPNQLVLIVNLLESYNLDCDIIKPTSSHPHNAEVYVVGYQKKGNQPTHHIRGEVNIFKWRLNRGTNHDVLSLYEYRINYFIHGMKVARNQPRKSFALSPCLNAINKGYVLGEISRIYLNRQHQKNILSALLVIESQSWLIERESGTPYRHTYVSKYMLSSLLVLSVTVSLTRTIKEVINVLDTLSLLRPEVNIVPGNLIELSLIPIVEVGQEADSVIGILSDNMKDFFRSYPTFKDPKRDNLNIPVLLPHDGGAKSQDLGRLLAGIKHDLRNLVGNTRSGYCKFFELKTSKRK